MSKFPNEAEQGAFFGKILSVAFMHGCGELADGDYQQQRKRRGIHS
jgi:hypothetical protein